MRIVTAREQYEMLSPWLREAMADTAPWHPHIQRFNDYTSDDGKTGEGEYWIRVPDESQPSGARVVGNMAYTLDDGEAYIHHVSVNPRIKVPGAGQALIERLMQDFPKHKINPGETTEQGTGFTQRLMDTIPGAQSRLSPNWRLSPLSQREQDNWLELQKGHWDRRSSDWDTLSKSDAGKKFIGHQGVD